MKPAPATKFYVEPRAAQQTPAQMVESMMLLIHGQFYGDANAHTWCRDRNYIKTEVVLWPATWLKKRGMTVPASTYERLLVEKINDVKRNCAQAEFTYFPAYLAKCIKDHFQFHADELNEQAKSVRGPVAALLGGLKPGRSPDLVDALVAARDVLVCRKRAKKPSPKAAVAVQKELW